MKKIKIAFFGNSSGARQWRFGDPAKYLNKTGDFEAYLVNEAVSEKVCEWADIIICQGLVDVKAMALLWYYKEERGKKLVIEFDDYIIVDDDSPHKEDHIAHQAPAVITESMRIADMVTTTTKYLANVYKEYNDNVVVLPNAMDMERWDLPYKLKNTSDKIRIGWGGSLTHMKDLDFVVDPINKILEEYPDVELIFVGETRVDRLFGDRAKTYLGVPFDNWPMRLNGLRLDIGIAPLIDSQFNRCKSNIKVMEYGINKVPAVASLVEPYKCYQGVIPLAKTKEDWRRELSELIRDESKRRALGESLYEHVRENYDLEKQIKSWVDAYKSLL